MQYNIYQIPVQGQYTDALIGMNARNILIVLRKDAYHADSEFLGKIMQSVDIDITKDCLVFACEDADYIPFYKIRETHDIQQVLVFGDCLKQIGIQARTPGNAPFPFGKTSFLRTYPLKELNGDQGKKRHLWNALKQMFQPG